jgi:cell wall-associated NlpC family hydrolase
MIDRQTVVDTARSYLGVKYRHQGRSRFGIDCLGLLVLVARDLWLFDADSNDYGRVPDGRKLQRGLEEHLDTSSGLKLGNILLMRFEKNPQHLAIVTDRGIIHSHSYAKKVVEHGLDDVWKDRIVREYTFRGLD